MNTIRSSFLFAAGLLVLWRPALAEDIELFVRADPKTSPPTVLFVIDNAASFSSSVPAGAHNCVIGGKINSLHDTAGSVEQCALYQVIDSLEPDSVNIGVMMYNGPGVQRYSDSGVPQRCDAIAGARAGDLGGCLVYPIKPLTAGNKTKLLTWIGSWSTDSKDKDPARHWIKTGSQANGASMQEAWAYLNAKTGLSGVSYSDRVLPATCNTYVLFLGNAYQSSSSPFDQTGVKGPEDPLVNRKLTPAGMWADPPATPEQKSPITGDWRTSCGNMLVTTSGGTAHRENSGYYADEWARYMNAHGITTYTIGVLGPKCQASYAALLTSMADVGGGKYFPTRNFDELVTAFQTALGEMLSVNSVFASVSLPISVNTEGTYLNQVYIGMFRPDKKTQPRWVGNLKQYRLGRYPQPAEGEVGDGPVKLVDANEPYKEAISDADTGFLGACALSYWTPAISDTYWQLLVERNCPGFDARSNTPDGPVVEKGAQGYVLRGTAVASRNLKTCGNAGCTAIGDFTVANGAITKGLLGNAAMTNEERAVLIDWARGQNNRGSAAARVVNPAELADESFVVDTAMRPSVHGDVVHSRPVAINFAEKADVAEGEEPPLDDPKVVVFYGGNDGVLRAVNGNRTAAIDDVAGVAGGSVPAGKELWGFVAPEYLRQVKRLRDNSPYIELKGFEDEPERQPKPYGFDGAVTAYAEGDDRWIFAAMRRGGRMVYAFDVSTITDDVDSPSILWRFGCPNLNDDVGCTVGDAAGIGQTWSAPKVMKNSRYKAGDKLKPIVIIGGGYDKCEDSDPHSCGDATKGDAIFVLDAATGAVLKTFPTDRPVAADVVVVPDGTTGRAKWVYAVDLGGNVYRISGGSDPGDPEPGDADDFNRPLEKSLPGNWRMKKIAALGCATPAPCAANRKFMYAPDVVLDTLPNGYVLLVGSGDREKPLHKDLSEEGDNKGYPSAYNTKNYFFMLRDMPTSAEWLEDEEATEDGPGPCGDPLLCLGSLLAIPDGATPTEDELSKKKGWYLGLEKGEQVVTSAITVYGGTTFSTHEPTVPYEREECTSDLGTARVYNVRYANAAPSKLGAKNRSEVIAGGGLPPSPVAGFVRLDTGEVVSFIIGGDASSPLEGGEPEQPKLTTLPKSITYWYIEK